jgi:drug/metabolite transporter (DMT)-like permease
MCEIRLKALFAVVVWGASFVAAKIALQEIQPVTLITLRFGMGVAILLLLLQRARGFQWLPARDIFFLALLGLISITIHQALQANGLLFTSATNMAWLVALIPVFTALLAWLFLAEKLNALKISGLIIAFVGAVTVVTKGAFTSDTLRLPSTTGDLLALASALNWAVFSVASKPFLRRLPPLLMMAYVMTLGWIFVLPFFFGAQGWNELSRLSLAGWLAVTFLGIFCSGIAYIFWYDALAAIDASQVSAFIYLEPLVTVVVAIALVTETFTLATFLGGLTILLGVALVNGSFARRAVA